MAANSFGGPSRLLSAGVDQIPKTYQGHKHDVRLRAYTQTQEQQRVRVDIYVRSFNLIRRDDLSVAATSDAHGQHDAKEYLNVFY